MKAVKTAVQNELVVARADVKNAVQRVKNILVMLKQERNFLKAGRVQAAVDRKAKTALRVVALAARKVATVAKREVAIERAKARLAKLLEDKQPKAGAAAIREARKPSKVIVTKYDTSRGRDASGQGPSW